MYQLLKIIKANYTTDYKIIIQFNNGVNGEINLKEKIFNDSRAVFHPLREVNYFKTFKQNRWTIEWNNGLDLAPEYLLNLLQTQQSTKLI